MRPIHPFPARMAPEIALEALSDLPKDSTVLDPMTGSGTVLREAVMRGYVAKGFDLDPLAVLISKVGTKRINILRLKETFENLISDAASRRSRNLYLPWIDDDKETSDFVNFWFNNPQKDDLRRIAYFLKKYEVDGVNQDIVNALKLALSRIIITKKSGASLAWDISHSRPHKVKVKNDYDVFEGYRKSVDRLAVQLNFEKKIGTAAICMGDARNLKKIKSGSIDAVITSPPYLNAIDYLRGHKFSLIWFGYSIPEIRGIRSVSIGTERGITIDCEDALEIRKRILEDGALAPSQIKMIDRYIKDAMSLMSEISRVVSKNGKAVLVVGNSCLKETYIKNSSIFEYAGKRSGLHLENSRKRELPRNNRYLPMPTGKQEALGKRMRYEIVQTYVH